MEKTSPNLVLFKSGSPLIKHTNKNELTNSSPQYPLSHQEKKYQKKGGENTSPASGQLDSHLSLKLTLDTYRCSTWPEPGQPLTVMSEEVTRVRPVRCLTAGDPRVYKETDRAAKKDIVRACGLISGCLTGSFLKFNIQRV